MKTSIQYGMLELSCVHCGQLSDESFSEDAIRILHQCGFSFVHPVTLVREADPKSHILPTQNPTSLTYRMLRANVVHPAAPRQYKQVTTRPKGWTSAHKFRTVARSFSTNTAYFNRGLSVHVELFSPDRDAFDATADESLPMLLPLIEQLRPEGSWIDKTSESFPSHTEILKLSPKKLTWVQHFGPGLVEKLGRKFLLSAPVWRAEDMGEIGVLLRATERLSDWLDGPPPKELLKYFAIVLPKIRQYRPKGDG